MKQQQDDSVAFETVVTGNLALICEKDEQTFTLPAIPSILKAATDRSLPKAVHVEENTVSVVSTRVKPTST
jgi:hypothetical protein